MQWFGHGTNSKPEIKSSMKQTNITSYALLLPVRWKSTMKETNITFYALYTTAFTTFSIREKCNKPKGLLDLHAFYNLVFWCLPWFSFSVHFCSLSPLACTHIILCPIYLRGVWSDDCSFCCQMFPDFWISCTPSRYSLPYHEYIKADPTQSNLKVKFFIGT